MARKARQKNDNEANDYRHTEAKRKNNPPAGLAPTYEVRERETKTYPAYDPHLNPQLLWANKPGLKKVEWNTDKTSFEVDVVSLHVHERISTKAIIKAVQRPEPPQGYLFAEPQLSPDKQIEFYKHDVDWANRLILGDSLLVMNSMLVREGMTGKVQMIYVDPPYGIKYSSNFQPAINQRDVKDTDEHLTREPEQIKAYRDTWTLGIHSYLNYLRDRLLLSRNLLHESGSIFVQIGDENLHLVRCLMDEVFGRENFVAVVAFLTTTGRGARYIDTIYDFLLWYGKNVSLLKYRDLFLERTSEMIAERYVNVELPTGETRRLSKSELEGTTSAPSGEYFRLSGVTSQGATIGETSAVFIYNGHEYRPSPNRHWSTTLDGLKRLASANRLTTEGSAIVYKRYHNDFPIFPLRNVWTDTGGGALVTQKLYTVQTITKVVERCLLMTTNPGDLVFDPTCVRRGTRVFTPLESPRQQGDTTPLNPPVNGGRVAGGDVNRGTNASPSPLTGRVGVGSPSPLTGRVRVGSQSPLTGRVRVGSQSPSLESIEAGLTPIESLHPGDLVIGHDGKTHKILRTIRKPYKGVMVGIRHKDSPQTLWATADHRILCQRRTRSYGADRTWQHVPKNHFELARAMRKETTPAERKLWSLLRQRPLGVKFRKQHPIGPYLVDFYSWEKGLVIEVDGDSHFRAESLQYDSRRDAYLKSLGLKVLRFNNQEVTHQTEAVLEKVVEIAQEVEPSEDHYKEWRRADSLQVGNIVYTGPEQGSIEITNLLYEETEEEVYDLEVEGTHSFITEVCTVHNCGSGTTAYVAEKWGRRWITCDTSRVALFLARQRLLTATFPYYELAYPEIGVSGGFIYETVPHITLESIAKNKEIDEIASRYQPQIDQALNELNKALGKDWKEWEVPSQPPSPLTGRVRVGSQSPLTGRAGVGANEAHNRFWELKQKKRKAIDESIQANAPQETLYDRPNIERKKARVSGPFTVEAIPAPMIEDPTKSPIPQYEEGPVENPAGNHIANMIELLRKGGVVFPGGKKMELEKLQPLNLGMLHAEAEARRNGKTLRVAVSIGPQYGPVTGMQVLESIQTAKVNAYDMLIFAGFSIDASAQALIQKEPVKGLAVQFAHISPDVQMGDLLKTTRASQLFTVFGQPDVEVEPQKDGTHIAKLRGVDVYDPIKGETEHASGEEVAAWFLDTDYDGSTFHICQAFFPNGGKDPWEKLSRALRGYIDLEKLESLKGTVSLPFKPGEHKRIAVKVIDYRGNEVMQIINLAPLTSHKRD